VELPLVSLSLLRTVAVPVLVCADEFVLVEGSAIDGVKKARFAIFKSSIF